MNLIEKTLSSELIYDGKIINVRRDTVELPNGKNAFREVVSHPGGVCIVAIDDEDFVYFVSQFRYPFATVIKEIPAGKLELGEDHRVTGIRELKEEIGAVAENFDYLGVIYPSTAYLGEKIYMYKATGLSFGEQHLDEDEFLSVEKIHKDEVLRMIRAGEFFDAKTITACLLALT